VELLRPKLFLKLVELSQEVAQLFVKLAEMFLKLVGGGGGVPQLYL
jgi:hypothetical protein